MSALGTIWNCPVSTQRVLILQKCALRIISLSPPRSPSAPLFKRFEILTIFDLVKTLDILFVHQHLNFQLPPDLCNIFHFNMIDHSYPIRSQSLGLLKCPKVSTVRYGQKSLYIQSITQWNHIKRLHPILIQISLNCPPKILNFLQNWISWIITDCYRFLIIFHFYKIHI